MLGYLLLIAVAGRRFFVGDRQRRLGFFDLDGGEEGGTGRLDALIARWVTLDAASVPHPARLREPFFEAPSEANR